MDCQGLVARLVMDFVLLTTAVEVAGRWRELAERLAKVSRQQMDAYEAPHRDRNGVVDIEVHLAYRLDFSMGMLCLFRLNLNKNQSKLEDTVFTEHSLQVCVEMPKQPFMVARKELQNHHHLVWIVGEKNIFTN